MKKDEIYKKQSKDKLKYAAKKKIDTTMIGALASIEKYFGFLWGQNTNGELTREQEAYEEIYENLRSEILDKGNKQIRLFNEELENYDVNFMRYEIVLPFKN